MNTFGSHSNSCALLMSHSRWMRLGRVCPNKGNLLSVTYNNYTAFSPHSNIFYGLSYTWNDAYPCGQKTTWNMNWNVNGGEKHCMWQVRLKCRWCYGHSTSLAHRGRFNFSSLAPCIAEDTKNSLEVLEVAVQQAQVKRLQ